MKIPSRFIVGGATVDVVVKDRIEDDKLGSCSLPEGRIELANTYYGRKQSEESMLNTFYHEMVHSILGTMGKDDLNDDESFVCTFASFLTECMTTMKF